MSLLLWYEERVGALPRRETMALSIATTILEAQLILHKDLNVVTVALSDNGQCMGLLTREQILSFSTQQRTDVLLEQLIPECSSAFSTDDLVLKAINEISRSKHVWFAITDQGVCVGATSSNDILKWLAEKQLSASKRSTDDVSSLALEFVSHVAHDIRNPLSVISTSCTLLARSDATAQDEQRYKDLIRRATNQVMKISDGLIEMQRYGFQESPVFKVIDLKTFMEDFAVENCDFLLGRGQVLTVDLYETRRINTDSHLLKRTILNMIERASKHSKNKGGIYLSVDFRSQHRHECVEFTVSDVPRDAQSMRSPMIRSETPVVLSSDRLAITHGLSLMIASRFARLLNGTLCIVEQKATQNYVLSIPVT